MPSILSLMLKGKRAQAEKMEGDGFCWWFFFLLLFISFHNALALRDASVCTYTDPRQVILRWNARDREMEAGCLSMDPVRRGSRCYYQLALQSVPETKKENPVELGIMGTKSSNSIINCEIYGH